MFRDVRRQNRVLEDNNRIQEIIIDGEYGFLSLGQSLDGYSYGIPMSYAYDKTTNSLYFHCAPEGHKLDNLKLNNKVSFCVVGVTQPIADKFTTLYESVVIFGKVDLDLDDEEKLKALRLLVAKYSKGFEEISEKYIKGSWGRTSCFKINIEHISAKAKY